MNGEIFAAADELHEKFRLGGVFVFAVVGRIERHRLEVAPKPLEEFVVKTVDVVTGRLKLLEKTLPTIERVLPLVPMEVEPDAEEFKGLVDAAESPFEVEFGLFVAFDDVFPTPDGVVVAVEVDEVLRDGENDAGDHAFERLSETVPDVDHHLGMVLHLRGGEDVGHLLLRIGKVGEVEPELAKPFAVAFLKVGRQDRPCAADPVFVVVRQRETPLLVSIGRSIIAERRRIGERRGSAGPKNQRPLPEYAQERHISAGKASVSLPPLLSSCLSFGRQ